MSIDLIFSELAGHQLEGVMLHAELSNYFDFLALSGFTAQQEYRFLEESKEDRELHRYYIEHFNRMIDISTVNLDSASRIPRDMFTMTRYDLINDDRRMAIKAAFDEWVTWERDTRRFLEGIYVKLFDESAISAGNFVLQKISDVAEELRQAEEQSLMLQSMDYDLPNIYDMQDDYFKFYTKKIKEDNKNARYKRD